MNITSKAIFVGALTMAVGLVTAANTIQAEAFNVGSGVTINGSYVTFNNSSTSYGEWNTLSVSNAGEYMVEFFYANGNQTANAVMARLSINSGSAIDASSSDLKALPYTGGASTYKSIKFNVRLNSGTNKIRVIKTTSTTTFNLDRIVIYAAKSKTYAGTVTGGYISIPEAVPSNLIRGFECLLTHPNHGYINHCPDDGFIPDLHGIGGIPEWEILTYKYSNEGVDPNYSLEVKYWE